VPEHVGEGGSPALAYEQMRSTQMHGGLARRARAAHRLACCPEGLEADVAPSGLRDEAGVDHRQQCIPLFTHGGLPAAIPKRVTGVVQVDGAEGGYGRRPSPRALRLKPPVFPQPRSGARSPRGGSGGYVGVMSVVQGPTLLPRDMSPCPGGGARRTLDARCQSFGSPTPDSRTAHVPGPEPAHFCMELRSPGIAVPRITPSPTSGKTQTKNDT
jgi:hypothetical protein